MPELHLTRRPIVDCWLLICYYLLLSFSMFLLHKNATGVWNTSWHEGSTVFVENTAAYIIFIFIVLVYRYKYVRMWLFMRKPVSFNVSINYSKQKFTIAWTDTIELTTQRQNQFQTKFIRRIQIIQQFYRPNKTQGKQTTGSHAGLRSQQKFQLCGFPRSNTYLRT